MRRNTAAAPDTLILTVLACAFAASVLLVLLLGAGIYQSAASSSDAAYSERVCTSYIAEKLRHGDENGAVSLGSFDGGEALFLESDDGGVRYTTIIYSHDGWLWELFCEKGADFSREDGVKIIEVRAVHFSEAEPGLFSIEAVGPGGAANRRTIHLRSGG